MMMKSSPANRTAISHLKRHFSVHNNRLMIDIKGVSKSGVDLTSNIKQQEARAISKNDIKIANQLVRTFESGTSIDPFDFSFARKNLDKKYRVYENPNALFDKVNPLNFYTNPAFLSGFINSCGQIKPRSVTKLSPINHNRLAKAIKRAQSIGLLSRVHQNIDSLPKLFEKRDNFVI
ncbi:hypothetical protein ACO0QE_004503 [Hanseniaspora vineae]